MASEPPTKRRRLSNDVSLVDSTNVSTPATTMSLFGQSSPTETMKQHEVGIQALVNPNMSHFSARLKARYSDFLVNECLPSGEVVHLHSTKAPKFDPSDSQTSKVVEEPPQVSQPVQQPMEDSDKQSKEPSDALPEVIESDKEKLIGYFNETAVAELLDLYQAIKANPGKRPGEYPVVRTDFTSDRSVRSQIHQSIREIFRSSIESSTDHDGILVLTAAKLVKPGKHANARNGPQFKNQRPGKLGWMERGGEYLHFTLIKENKDTMEVVSWLSRQLRCNPKSFQFAGTKDRRAVTTQRCSAYRLEVERLAAQNRTLRGSKIGDFEYRTHGLELGDLSGNEFIITLRDVQMEGSTDNHNLVQIQNEMQMGMQSLRGNGYLNYFGLQRFGTFSTRTDVIGRHILREDPQAACDAILQYSETALEAAQEGADSKVSQDDRNRALGINKWHEDRRAFAALEILPRKFSAEAQIIRHLSKHPSDPYGALMSIQRNLRLMYVHAYQSYIWNMALSTRIRTHGTKVIKGDLVLINEHKDKETNNSNQNETHLDADGEEIIAPANHDRAAQEDEIFERARPLTASEADSGQYTIFDIVLPLPGFDVIYPDNDIATFYKTLMSSPEGGNLDPYNMRRRQRDFSLSGSYRKLISRIGPDFDVAVHRYERDEEQFVETDLDSLRKRENQDSKTEGFANENGQVDGVPVQKDSGEKIAVVLKFQLGSSQYATMVLRELSRNGIIQHKPDFGGGR